MNTIELQWFLSDQNDAIIKKSGIYMVNDDQYVHGKNCLVYIGIAKSLELRLKEHKEWLNRGRNIEIRIAECKEEYLEDVESLIIFSHQPIYNTSKKNDLNLSNDLKIYNYGNFGSLLPIIDSRYKWYGKAW